MNHRIVLGFTAGVVFAVSIAFVSRVMPSGSVLEAAQKGRCQGLPNDATLKGLLANAPGHGGDAGGLFHGSRMWGAIVNRAGELCTAATSTNDPTQVWPGSQAIAKEKAYTANAFSLDT